jgi:hypothetical protein
VANKNPKTEALNQYNKDRSIKTRAKIKHSLEKMLQNSEVINIQRLSRESGISRTTIYRDQEIRDLIDRFRETSILRSNSKVKYEKDLALERSASSKLRVLMDKIKEERKVIASLREENHTLKQHIEYLTQKYSNVKKIN